MSTKSKASSKNKKAPAKKAVAKKTPAKKKAVKPAAKAKPVKKAAAKTKVVTSKASATKKTAAKKVVAKKSVKKAAPKKIAKPAKKVVAKKAATLPAGKAGKKVVKKVIAKKVVAKKATAKKTVKKVAPKKVIAKKTVTKKVAPQPAGKAGKKAEAKKIIAKAPVKASPLQSKKEVKPLHSKTSTLKEIKHIIEEVTEYKADTPADSGTTVPKKAAKVKKEKAPVIKKPIVAPTTFRKEDNTPVKFIKEPAGKFEMEFVIRASEDMVFEFVSTESGLSEWFCDDVTIRNGIFTFNWDGQEQQAKLVKEIPPMYIRYQWLDKNDGSYFEFRTQKDELTNDISLIITDFAADKADEESARLLWHSQVDKLLHVLGSFF